ncbi:uncharacterized protein [Ptychodera flava]|uniref:uncharacterized protein n=1 Tax=Ptychodera flava TaxID=63121 RepID=UPI00396A47B3
MSDDGSRLYVGGLSYSTDNVTLEMEMAKYGSVIEATVRKDKFTGKSRGFGFVTFDNPDDASAAIDGMNGKMLDGRPITVGYARKESRDGGGQYGGGGGGGGRRSDGDPYKLYIGGLHEETDEDILEKEASKYGKVEDVFLIKDRVSQQSRGFAFVKYESSEDASMAKEALDGKDFDGGTLIVQHARKSRPGGGGRGDYGGGDRYGGRDNRRDGGYGGRSYRGWRRRRLWWRFWWRKQLRQRQWRLWGRKVRWLRRWWLQKLRQRQPKLL